ncbi:sensor histidine kinase [Taibaiella koreensis]|uniref:sensor histidine kinase n=1 Tax=Taibaiella koreensis TaxID=1268548 RepID=UPI000E5991F5|nr:HAMP domain-containing sensor histidine kinase [Taibaiella koreensis]
MQSVKGKNKLRRTRLIMIAGYILLVGFTAQWLYTQYEREEHNLQKELSKLFDRVQQGITDSLLLVSVIDPQATGQARVTEAPPVNGQISLSDDTLKKLSSLLFRDSGRDASIQGLKMAVRRVRQLSPTEKQYLFHIDTSVFHNEFADRMRRMGWTFPVQWIAASGKPFGEESIFIPNHYLQPGYGVVITRYRGYILQKLWPQSIFVLVLLGVILLAFYTTYKSLLRQIQLGAMKDDFVSNMSHELKTPIATMKVALEAIRHFDEAGQKTLTAEYMEMATLELERLELLVNRSLHTSLLESGKLAIQPELCDLKVITEEVLQAYQVKLLTYDAEVNFEARGIHFLTMADKLHFQGVLINLLDNSLKYGQDQIRIQVLLEQEGEQLMVSVTDNGPGIPEDYHRKIFEKFFRVPSDSGHRVKGYGLGLSYARQVMQQHQGSIAVANMPEGGCRFTLCL